MDSSQLVICLSPPTPSPDQESWDNIAHRLLSHTLHSKLRTWLDLFHKKCGWWCLSQGRGVTQQSCSGTSACRCFVLITIILVLNYNQVELLTSQRVSTEYHDCSVNRREKLYSFSASSYVHVKLAEVSLPRSIIILHESLIHCWWMIFSLHLIRYNSPWKPSSLLIKDLFFVFWSDYSPWKTISLLMKDLFFVFENAGPSTFTCRVKFYFPQICFFFHRRLSDPVSVWISILFAD